MNDFTVWRSSLWVVCLIAAMRPAAFAAEPQPNFIIVLADNLGYGDLGCYGSQLHRTPHLDTMADEGLRFTDFYVSSGVCTPSRASLMTGCYAQRVGLHWTESDGIVLRPVSPRGLHPNEVTIAERLKELGYNTYCIGKWHLGDQPEFLPTRQGFDHYFGIPYSDDMTPRAGKPWPPLPLMRDEMVIEAPVDRDYLTKRYTEEAVKYIGEQAKADAPFFLYIPQAMPGSTRTPYASPAFQGKSQNGKYGDSIEELDWSMGEILQALKQHNMDENTLVFWLSDNGPPKRNPPQGRTDPLSGFGYNTSEGAMRVPCLARWPAGIPAGGECDLVITSMDLFPTLVELAGGTPKIKTDGKSIVDVLRGERSKPVHKYFAYYQATQLQAIRSGEWKLYLELDEFFLRTGKPGGGEVAKLFNLRDDISERRNVIDDHPDVVARLNGYAEQVRRDLGDWKQPGKGQRDAGWVEEPTARELR